MKYLPDSKVRTHFRQLNIEDDHYYQNCIFGVDFENYVMKPKAWGELLEASYKARRPLIASVNSGYCRKSISDNEVKENEANKWDDFITVVPDFAKNFYVEKDRKSGIIIKERPLLTFGITVYRAQNRNLLYILDYLRIDRMIGELLRNFLYYLPIDLTKYVSSMNKKGVD